MICIIGKINQKSKKINIVLSYCLKKNFDKKGNYYDEYFGTHLIQRKLHGY